jgi:hypothetical protein
MIREFSTVDVLTIVTGKRLCDSFHGTKRLIAFLFGDPDGAVYTITMADLAEESASRILAQRPDLLPFYNIEAGPDWESWLQEQVAFLGDTIALELGECVEEFD